MVGGQPLQQRAGVMQTEPDARVSLQGAEHGRVGTLVDVLDDPTKVADRLVVVDYERERNAAAQSRLSPLRWPLGGSLAS